MNDLDQERSAELTRTREQLFALAEVARHYRDLVLLICPCATKTSNAVKLLHADTALRDVLTLVGRMKRFK